MIASTNQTGTGTGTGSAIPGPSAKLTGKKRSRSHVASASYKDYDFFAVNVEIDRPPKEGEFKIWGLNAPTIEIPDQWLRPPFVTINDTKNHQMQISLENEELLGFFRKLEERLYEIIYNNRATLLPKVNQQKLTLDSLKHFTAPNLVVAYDAERAYDPTVKIKIDRKAKVFRYKGTDVNGKVKLSSNIDVTDISWKSRVKLTLIPSYFCVYNGGTKISVGLKTSALIVKQPQQGFDFILDPEREGSVGESNRLYSAFDPSSIAFKTQVKQNQYGLKSVQLQNSSTRVQLPEMKAPFGFSYPMNYEEGQDLTKVNVSLNVSDAGAQAFLRQVDDRMVSTLSQNSAKWMKRPISEDDVREHIYRTTLYQKNEEYAPKLRLPISLTGGNPTRVWIRAQGGEGENAKYELTTHESITKGSTVVPIVSFSRIWLKSDGSGLTIYCTDLLITSQGTNQQATNLFGEMKFEVVDSDNDNENEEEANRNPGGETGTNGPNGPNAGEDAGGILGYFKGGDAI